LYIYLWLTLVDSVNNLISLRLILIELLISFSSRNKLVYVVVEG